MGKLAFFIYAAGIGWYVRASGLDKELADLVREGYDLTVLHTAEVLRRASPPELASSGSSTEVAA
ncbi:MAG TPA: hypothetical protein VGI05_26635 [Streptosporangiaceae bacterium]